MRTFASAARLRKWTISILLLLFASISQAQEKTITGLVKNLEDGKPVVNATIMVKGTKLFTVSADNGNYSIKASPGQTLVVSSVGFKPAE